MEVEKERLKATSDEGKTASNRVTELEEELRKLRIELEQERGEKQDLVSEKEMTKKKHDEVECDLFVVSFSSIHLTVTSNIWLVIWQVVMLFDLTGSDAVWFDR